MAVQRQYHRMLARPARRDALPVLAPPLQANLPDHRLADGFACTGDFGIEGIKGQQRRAARIRCEQGSPLAVRILAADLGGVVFDRRLGHWATRPWLTGNRVLSAFRSPHSCSPALSVS